MIWAQILDIWSAFRTGPVEVVRSLNWMRSGSVPPEVFLVWQKQRPSESLWWNHHLDRRSRRIPEEDTAVEERRFQNALGVSWSSFRDLTSENHDRKSTVMSPVLKETINRGEPMTFWL